MSMLVMTAQSVSTMLTASRRPPRPTSSTARSSGVCDSSRMMARLVNSKYVSETSPRAASTASKCGTSAAALTAAPSMRQRSSKRTRCGEV